jgi:di/tricarboxylate transporter
VLDATADLPFARKAPLALLIMMGIIVSNNAATVIGTPIAVSIAAQIGQPAVPFVLAVLFGANMSYATPMAYKTGVYAWHYVFISVKCCFIK